ncbi:MAG: Nif3-like dinuclear metal center hexameric protein [Luteimonas sp.]
MSRRSVLAAIAALAAAPLRLSATGTPPTLTAGQVVERIKAAVGVDWQSQTVDRIVAGAPGTPVTGIATTMGASLEVLRRAAADGLNMIIAHEPTFHDHFDDPDAFGEDSTVRHKRDFIATNDMVVFRFHDHWHAMAPDGIGVGMAQALGWQEYADPARSGEFALPPTPLSRLADHLAGRLGAEAMRLMGDPALPVRRVATAWGYADLERLRAVAARSDVDLVIVGETREWELVPYVADQIAQGLPKALVVLGHVASEQAGMAYCAQWLRPLLGGTRVEFIAQREPLRGYRPGADRDSAVSTGAGRTAKMFEKYR